MAFNSYTFFMFFIIVLAFHYSALPWSAKKGFLLVASYLFYAAWNPPFVLLLWISTGADWFIARRMYAAKTHRSRKLMLFATLGVNLGLLGFFKYGNFALDNLVALLSTLNISFSPARPDILLPLGISFYTFQTLSYTLDIYLKKSKPWHSFIDYAMYVTFFPQLVAGPIVRANDFLPQCLTEKRAKPHQFAWGLTLMVVGLFQKVVLSDSILAPVAENLFSAAKTPNFWTAWYGSLAFTGQIFCDFAGYSTIAIGTAMCLGFALPDNFRAPYAAVGFSDFWRRWHMSLSSWLRDYLYIPLGGNRLGEVRSFINLMVTMLLGGLWHGAAWTFILWGGFHGLLLGVERILKKLFGGYGVWKRWYAQLPLGLVTFFFVMIGWIFFRSDSLTQAAGIISALFSYSPAGVQGYMRPDAIFHTQIVICSLLVIQWALRNHTLEEVTSKVPSLGRALALTIMITMIFMTPGEDRGFIYFQF